MALVYPGATYRPLGPQTQSRLTYRDIVCLHTMVGSLWGTDAYFRRSGYGGTESHFGVGYDGEVLQWQDLDYRADANLDGNDHIISIETADYGTGFSKWNLNDASQVPAWTGAQVEAIAKLTAWLCDRFDLPIAQVPDSRRGHQGVAYHRQGVPGYMVSGGERWSTAYRKACPGDRRIAQIPEVIRRAHGGVAAPTPAVPAKRKAPPEMIERQLVTGANYGRVACPTGPGTSSLVVDSWVSVTGEGGGDLTVLFQKNAAIDGPPPGAGAAWKGTYRNASRVWEPIPDGTEFIEYWINVKGKGGSLLIEQRPA